MLHRLVSWLVLVMLLALPVGSALAQAPAPYQVWYVASNETNPLPRIEYRDAGGTVVASYTLATDAFNWPQFGGGNLYGWSDQWIPVFDPTVGLIGYQLVELPQTTGDQDWSTFTQLAANPTEPIFAYGVMLQPADYTQSATSWVYVVDRRQGVARPVLNESTESFLAVAPLGWVNSNTLLLEDMPQGIGGYILFWQHVNVRALDLTTGATSLLGTLDGYSSDLQQTATVERDDAGIVTGLTLHALGSGAQAFHPLPNLGEVAYLGGGATFSPDNAYVAYQVARGTMQDEKYWTIVLNILTGESRVVLEDEAANNEVRYANIGGWLDNNRLVVGAAWTGQSAVIDVTTGAFLGEVPGALLGTTGDVSGFVPSGMIYAQCPGAPVSRLVPQARGRMTIIDGSTTNVRSWPGLSGEITAALPEGTTFTVSAGPTCADGYAWWSLQFDDGSYGYVAEGSAENYYLEPWQ